eukprot:TRINITY_DN2078_c0_g1_i1.p1 TRINITY_DN2078_c0_g1~~TRINITY_DN2078_c0_g1_i1.p1  ORF type:complete len:508 (-),score=110.05 TRINITY_DN2078_c0_g1_i1:1066-2589(-)
MSLVSKVLIFSFVAVLVSAQPSNDCMCYIGDHVIPDQYVLFGRMSTPRIPGANCTRTPPSSSPFYIKCRCPCPLPPPPPPPPPQLSSPPPPPPPPAQLTPPPPMNNTNSTPTPPPMPWPMNNTNSTPTPPLMPWPMNNTNSTPTPPPMPWPMNNTNSTPTPPPMPWPTNNTNSTPVTYAVTTLAGNGVQMPNDGTGVRSSLFGVARYLVPAADEGTFLFADGSSVRALSTMGIVTTVAGNSTANGNTDGMSGSARFNTVGQVAYVPALQATLVPDYNNHCIRMLSQSTGAVMTLAGLCGVEGNADGENNTARFSQPLAVVAVGQHPPLFPGMEEVTEMVVLQQAQSSTLRWMNVSRLMTNTVAMVNGNVSLPFMATSVVHAGNGVILVSSRSAIYRINQSGIPTLMTGMESSPGAADGSLAQAQFSNINAMAMDLTTGNLWVAQSNAIRLVGMTEVTTVAGVTDVAGYADGFGSAARFTDIRGVAMSTTTPDLYVLSEGRARKVTMM